MRGKKDEKFFVLLDSVRCGFPTNKALDNLQQRVIQVSVLQKFAELQQHGLSPVCLVQGENNAMN